MAQAQIFRPEPLTCFTSLPNEIFNFGQFWDDLKPRDVALLNYFFSKNTTTHWHIRWEHIQASLNIGISTAKRALTKLRQLGFASYQRAADGRTYWRFHMPKDFNKSAVILDKSPHSQKPHVEKPQGVFDDVLERNNLLQINKETTNPVVVSLPDVVNKPVVEKELSKLAATQQAAVLTVLASMMAKGAVESPVAYVRGLIKIAAGGDLEVTSAANTAPVVKSVDKESRLRAFIERNRAKLAVDLQDKDFVSVSGLGNVTRDDFKRFVAE